MRADRQIERWRARIARFAVSLAVLVLWGLFASVLASAQVSFVKAYGWGVLDGADQFETCTITCYGGISGGGAGEFGYDSAAGVAIDPSGDVYVTDPNSGRIDEFSVAGSFVKAYGWGVLDGAKRFETCTSTCQAGILGAGTGQLADPLGVTTDRSGNVYVADGAGNRIDEFSAAGSFVRFYGSCPSDPSTCSGLAVSGAGALDYPVGVAIDRSGNVDVASAWRINEFSAAGSWIKAYGWGVLDGVDQFETCTTICGGGFASGPGTEPRGMAPSGMAIGRSGVVYVADNLGERIDEFSAAGSFIKSFGSGGHGAGQFDFIASASPWDMAIDSSGDVYVPDSGNNRIDEFSAAGSFIEAFGWGVSDGANRFETCTSSCQAGILGVGTGQLSYPYAVAIDSSGDLYVPDRYHNRINEFHVTPTASPLSFKWAMADHLGPHEIGSTYCKTHVLDYTCALNPGHWRVKFTVSDTAAPAGSTCDPSATYTFSAAAPDGSPIDLASHRIGPCEWTGHFPALDKGYKVTLSRTGSNAPDDTQTIHPVDWLIVSLGDSVGAGEGAPDSPAVQALCPDRSYPAAWEDGAGPSWCGGARRYLPIPPLSQSGLSQCHRSVNAASYQAAEMLQEHADNTTRHTSVTFLHLACSGAGIETGVLGPYKGLWGQVLLPSQLAVLKHDVGTRRIGALIINVGANDIGFGSILRLCTIPRTVLALMLVRGKMDCYDDQHMSWQSSEDGGSYVQSDCLLCGGTSLEHAVQTRIELLAAAYSRLANKLDTLRFSSTQSGKLPIYIDQYYNPVPLQDGICSGRHGGTGYLNQDELSWVNSFVVTPLNRAVAHAASAGRWDLVHDQTDFGGHGMCAPDSTRWVNTLDDVLGPNGQNDIWGTGHPNKAGYRDIALEEVADILPNLPSP